MTFTYPAVFTPKKEGAGYYVAFPDLEGCEAQGPDLEDAIDNAADAAYNWICAEMEEEECELPPQTHEDDIELKEWEFVRRILVRIKLLPDND